MADAIHFGEHVVEKIAVILSKLSVQKGVTLVDLEKCCKMNL